MAKVIDSDMSCYNVGELVEVLRGFMEPSGFDGSVSGECCSLWASYFFQVLGAAGSLS